MATYTITTTDEQEAGLTYAYEQAKKLSGSVGGIPVPLPPRTQQGFLQQRVNQSVLDPMVRSHREAKNVVLVTSLDTIPVENRDKAKAEMEAVIVSNGGEVITGA